MVTRSEAVTSWRQRTKERIVESMGGCCVCCGYNKCFRALDLHHLDPSEKEFAFSCMVANPKSWDTIVKELRKCVLVCNRCHQEIHAGVTELPLLYRGFNEQFMNYKKIQDHVLCPVCRVNEMPHTNKCCSQACAAKLRGKVDWDKVDLHQMLIVEKRTFTSIGRDLGVTDSAVSKRARKLGIC